MRAGINASKIPRPSLDAYHIETPEGYQFNIEIDVWFDEIV